MGLGSVLGGLAGLLIPGGGALTAAIGSGIGSLIEGDDPRKAIRNAALAGIGSAVFPNVTRALQDTSMARAATRTLGSMGIGTRAGLEAMRGSTALGAIRPVPRPSALGQAAAETGGGGFLRNMNLGQASGLLTLAGAVMEPQEELSYGPPAGFGEAAPRREDWSQNLYANKYTGERFNTPEERDASERAYERAYLTTDLSFGTEVGSDTYTPVQGFAGGGMIRGPGTVTSDSIPAKITQNGRPVEDILVSNGEVILSGKDLAGLDPDGDMDRAARKLDSVPSGSRGAMAAKMYADVLNKRA
jgi:hypothetical protein